MDLYQLESSNWKSVCRLRYSVQMSVIAAYLLGQVRSKFVTYMKNRKWRLSPKRGRISEKDYLTKCDANGPLKDWPK